MDWDVKPQNKQITLHKELEEISYETTDLKYRYAYFRVLLSAHVHAV